MAGILKVDRIQEANSGQGVELSHKLVDTSGNTIISENNGVATFGSSVAPSKNYTFRNKIINGDMRIDQRNSGSAISSHSTFVVDRINCALQGGTASGITVQQSSDVPSNSEFKNSIVYTTSTGGSVGSSGTYGVQQRIEGYNFSDFMYGTDYAKRFTLSFWVKSSVTGNYGIGLRNSAKDRSYIATYSISTADTWEYKTITVSGDTNTSATWLSDNGTGLDIFFSLGVGTNHSTTSNSWQTGNLFGLTGGASPVETSGSTWYITGVQLEEGTVATPFEHRPYGTELALCQRYFCKTGQNIFSGRGNSTSAVFGITTPVSMRSVPTIITNGNIVVYDHDSHESSSTDTVTASGSTTPDGFGFRCIVSGVTAPNNRVHAIESEDTMTFSAEL